MLKINILFFIMCAAINICRASNFHAESGFHQVDVNAGELTKVLGGRSYEDSVKVLNNVKGMRYSGHLIPTLVKLWSGDEVKGVDKNFISSPRIRIELADILLQQHRNGAKDLDAKAYEDYARSLINSPDPDVARQAILVLGVANNPGDKSVFIGIFSDVKSPHWRAAGLSLIASCATSYSAIQKISSKVSDERRRFILDGWEAQKSFRICR